MATPHGRVRAADSQDNHGPDGEEPAGGYIIARPGEIWPETLYVASLHGVYLGAPYPAYDDALEALAGAIASLGPAYAATPVWYVAERTGLRVPFGMPIADVRVDWDRPVNPADVEAFAECDAAGGAIGHEALCLLCGQIFNPHGPDDLVHLERYPEDQINDREGPCGGPGVLVGYWR